jgi:hypothetical protein
MHKKSYTTILEFINTKKYAYNPNQLVGNEFMRIDILPFHLFLYMHTYYLLFQNQSRPCTSFFLKYNLMIPVVPSTVKIYFMHFGQKNRRNSLLKVALGVVLEVFAQYL